MTVERIINRLTQYCSWLYYRRWERSELVAISVVAGLALLIALIKAHRRAVADAKRFRERSPMIGLRLGEHRRGHY
jgi:hypothetical protein